MRIDLTPIENLESKYILPFRILIITILGIFLSEILAMSVVYFLDGLPYWILSVIDGFITVTAVFPLIYYFSFRMLIRHIAERKRAEEQLESKNYELQELSRSEQKQRQLAESLVEASLALNASLDLEEVLRRIFDSLQRAIPFKTADILLFEGEFFSIAHHWGFENMPEAILSLEKRYRLDSFPILQRVTTTQRPILVSDAFSEADWRTNPGIEWVRSYLGAPLVAGDEVIGLIELNSEHPASFTEEMAQRVMAFAAPAAVAIQNARLYAAESQARQVAEILSEVSLALTQTLDIEAIMNSLLAFIHRLVAYDCASIFLLEDESRLAVHAVQCYSTLCSCTPVLHTVFDAWDYPYIEKVISSLKSVLIDDTQEYADWPPGLFSENIRNWFGIPIAAGGKAIGIISVAKTRPGYFNNQQVQISEAIVAQVSVAVQNAWLFEQVRAGRERLQSLSRRLVEKQENERRYISRELHDETSQALTSIMFGLRLLEQEIDGHADIKPQIASLMQVTDGVLENLHNLAVNLRPVSLDHLGLNPALEQLIKEVSERYHLKVRFKNIGFREGERLPEEIETSLYRIIQEALTNAVRHAKASRVDVILERQDEMIVVIVEDNGAGFDTDLIQRSGHLGLLGMQERAQMLLGELHIESKPGEGTTILVEIPYVHEHTNRG
jgi:signal transduction histidine kinase